MSNISDHCLMNGFQIFLTSGDNQFGFIKDLDVDNTANLCVIGMSKAFDKINHHALFVKLMKRHVPIEFLEVRKLAL